jgi:hypothetical protein
MDNLQALQLPALVDMLAEYTVSYTKMLSDGATEDEFKKCKLMIDAIQLEIETRKNFGDNTTLTNPSIDFIE